MHWSHHQEVPKCGLLYGEVWGLVVCACIHSEVTDGSHSPLYHLRREAVLNGLINAFSVIVPC
jgi:hypothetical protein